MLTEIQNPTTKSVDTTGQISRDPSATLNLPEMPCLCVLARLHLQGHLPERKELGHLLSMRNPRLCLKPAKAYLSESPGQSGNHARPTDRPGISYDFHTGVEESFIEFD